MMHFISALPILLLAGAALAASPPVQQDGPASENHPAIFAGNGLIKDSGATIECPLLPALTGDVTSSACAVTVLAIHTTLPSTWTASPGYTYSGNTLGITNYTFGTVSVPNSNELDIIRMDITNDGNGEMNGLNCNFVLGSGAASNVDFCAGGNITTNGASPAKVIHGTAISGSGATGPLFGVVGEVVPVAGNSTIAYAFQGAVVGGSPPNDGGILWADATNSGGSITNTNVPYGAKFDRSLQFTQAAYAAYAGGSGDFLRFWDPTASFYEFQVTATGVINDTITSAGALTLPLNLINNSATASTAVGLNLQPSASAARIASIQASNNGSSVITTNFINNAGSAADTILSLVPSGTNGLTITSSTGQVNLSSATSIVLNTNTTAADNFQVNGTTTLNGPVAIPFGTPSSSSAACVQGQIEFDSSFIYTCVATNTWTRAATSSF